MADFKGKNSLASSRAIFIEELKYLTDPVNVGFKNNYVNYRRFNLFEFQLYGRVSRNFVPISLLTRERMNRPEPTLKSFQANQSLRAVNFVVDAFEDFAATFVNQCSLNLIDTEDPHLSSPVPKKAHMNTYSLYDNYRRTVYDALMSDLNDRKFKMRNFNEFVNYVLPSLIGLSKKVPVTMAGYIKNRRCAPHVSGLVIEIADMAYDVDQRKYESFVQSTNFEFYLNNALAHGFYVDYDIPWRLVADIGSPAMLRYMKEYGITSTDDFLTTYYDFAAVSDFELFVRTVVGYYNSFVESNPYEIVPYSCVGSSETMIEPVQPTPITIDSVFSSVGQQLWWLKTYFRMRIYESGNHLKDNEAEIVFRNLKNMVDKSDFRDILLYMERAIADVSEESGSMDSFMNRQDNFEDVEMPLWYETEQIFESGPVRDPILEDDESV